MIFECLNSAENYEGPCSQKYEDCIPCSFAYKIVCIDDKFSKPTVVYRVAAYKFIEAILREHRYCKKVLKKDFNICGICEKRNEDENVRDHCHITGQLRGAAHWSCNINLKLTRNVPVIFHNLRGYDSHLIFYELEKFDVKIDVRPNGLEKYMAFMINKNLVFIGSM